jgi:hypothetical protein
MEIEPFYGSFHIIHPRGDRKKVTVLDLGEYEKYELEHYTLASGRTFENLKGAITHARRMSEVHGIEYVMFTPRNPGLEEEYLDTFMEG